MPNQRPTTSTRLTSRSLFSPTFQSTATPGKLLLTPRTHAIDLINQTHRDLYKGVGGTGLNAAGLKVLSFYNAGPARTSFKGDMKLFFNVRQNLQLELESKFRLTSFSVPIEQKPRQWNRFP